MDDLATYEALAYCFEIYILIYIFLLTEACIRVCFTAYVIRSARVLRRPGPMKFVRRFQLLFLLLLTLGVFCDELVELVRLADDVSNDFVQVSIARVAECAEAAQWDETSSRRDAALREFIRGFAIVPSIALAVSSGQDLLRLLSVQRK